MTRLLAARILAAAALCGALAVLGVAGCSSNRPGTILSPTGYQPAPANPTGGLTGRLLYDPANTPDLSTAPFPPTRLRLLLGGQVVRELQAGGATDQFTFSSLPPGRYTVTASSHAFQPASLPPMLVTDAVRETDDLTMRVSIDSLNTVYIAVVGQMPGFGIDGFNFGDTSMLGTALGLWTYPNDFATPVPVQAGTYRFKFVTDPTGATGTIGWGGDSTVVLTAPLASSPVRFGAGAAYDLKVNFPTTGVYQFVLDERRLTFSVQLAPTAPALASRRTR